MRILMLNQAPRVPNRHPGYDVEPITKLLNSYASPGTRIEIHFPDDFEGSDVMHTLGAQSQLNEARIRHRGSSRTSGTLPVK